MKKEERLAKKQKEDQALNRVLWWFGGAVILEFLLLLINRFGVHFDPNGTELAAGIFRFLRIFAWVCLALAVACFVWWLLTRKQKKAGKTFLPGALTLAFLLLFGCSFVAAMWKGVGVELLYVSVPVLAVLALIYYLYQREFFFVALQGGLALFCMWAYRKVIYRDLGFIHGTPLVYGIFIAAAVLTVAAVALFVYLQKNKGRLGKLRALPKKANYTPLYIAAGVTLLSLLITYFQGASAAYICLFGVVAWLFGAAVYYTVRLM